MILYCIILMAYICHFYKIFTYILLILHCILNLNYPRNFFTECSCVWGEGFLGCFFFFGRVVKEINIIVINIFVFPILGEFSQIPLGIFIAITIVSAILNIFFFYRIKSRYVSFHFAGTIMLLMCQDSIYCQTYECKQHIISTYTHQIMLNVYAEYTVKRIFSKYNW